MEFAKWESRLALGIDDIDQQHRGFIEILQKLHESFMKKDSVDLLNSVVLEMVEYADYHFKAEEEQMSAHSYPDYPSHRHEHERFAQKIQALQERQKQGENVFSIEVITFLRDWFLNHIQGTDQKFAAFLKENVAK